jgi:hypothetical protein
VGRQKIPVVRTQAKNSPSNDWSRSTSARYISVVEGSVIMPPRVGRSAQYALPGFGRAILIAERRLQIEDSRSVIRQSAVGNRQCHL